MAVVIGVVSDTHGRFDPKVEEVLRAHNVSHILHAGDIGDFQVLEALEKIAPVTAVLGNVDMKHPDLTSRLREVEEVEVAPGVRVLLTHICGFPPACLKTLPGHLRDQVLDAISGRVNVVVFGHSHVPGQQRHENVLYLNPGSCGPRRFKLPRTVAVLQIAVPANQDCPSLDDVASTVSSPTVSATIIDLDKECLGLARGVDVQFNGVQEPLASDTVPSPLQAGFDAGAPGQSGRVIDCDAGAPRPSRHVIDSTAGAPRPSGHAINSNPGAPRLSGCVVDSDVGAPRPSRRGTKQTHKISTVGHVPHSRRHSSRDQNRLSDIDAYSCPGTNQTDEMPSEQLSASVVSAKAVQYDPRRFARDSTVSASQASANGAAGVARTPQAKRTRGGALKENVRSQNAAEHSVGQGELETGVPNSRRLRASHS